MRRINFVANISIRLAYASLLVLTGVGVIIFEPKIKQTLRKANVFRRREIEKKEAC